MKRPYFNKEQREAIYFDTLLGNHLMLILEVKKTLRDVRRTDGWVAMKKKEREIIRMINLAIFRTDSPRKWWQLF